MLLLGSLLLAGAGRVSLAQETLKVNNVPRGYDLTVHMKGCGDDPDVCSGPAHVSISRKGAGTALQVLSLANVEINRETVADDPQLNAQPRNVYAVKYSFIAADFNFDGRQDLAIRNGRDSGYGGASYTIFLFNARSKKFVENRKFSALAEGPYLGLFSVEAKKRRLVATSKSGCCFHQTDTYKVVGDRPVLVEEIIEDLMGTPGYAVTTTRRLVGGRWVRRVRKQKM